MKPRKIWIATMVGFISSKKRQKEIKPVAVKHFNLERYLGKWYEIARLDFFYERNLDNVTAQYYLNEDGSIRVVNSGYNYKTYQRETVTGKAVFAGSKDEGKFKISFLGPFYSDYTIMAIDKDYQYALIAGKNLNYLWLLSRTTSMPENIRKSYLELAKDVGYATDKLICVEHY